MGAHWIKMQWCSHGVKKDYVCLAHGWVDTSVTEINKRIAKKAEQLNQFMTERCFVSELGKPAFTEVATLAHLSRPANSLLEAGREASVGQYSLVALKLHTGRTHQI